MTMLKEALNRNGEAGRAPGTQTGSWWYRLQGWWSTALNRLAPLGYEDATGFHFGVEDNVSVADIPPAFRMRTVTGTQGAAGEAPRAWKTHVYTHSS